MSFSAKAAVIGLFGVLGTFAHAGLYDTLNCAASGLTNSEQLMCKDTSLRIEYSSVNGFLNSLIRRSPQNEFAFRDNQEKWVALLLDVCTDKQCLLAQLSARRAALAEQYSQISAEQQPQLRRQLAEQPHPPTPQRTITSEVMRPKVGDLQQESLARSEAAYQERVAANEQRKEARRQQQAEQERLRTEEFNKQQAELTAARKTALEADAKRRAAQAEEDAKAQKLREAADAERKRNERIKSGVIDIVLWGLVINALVVVYRRSKGTMQLYTSYTDMAMVTLTPIIPFAMAFLLAMVGLWHPLAVGLSILTAVALLGAVFVNSARTNSSLVSALSAFVAKFTLLGVGLVVALVILRLLGSSKRAKYERHTTYQARARAQAVFAAAAGVGAGAWIGHMLCTVHAFIPLEEYLLGETTSDSPDAEPTSA